MDPLEKGREEWKILDENTKLQITNEIRKCLMNFSLNVKRTTRANLITAQIGSDVWPCRNQVEPKAKELSKHIPSKKRRPALPNTRSLSYSLYRTCVCVVALVVVVAGRDESHLLVEPTQGKPCQLVSGYFFVNFIGLSAHYCIGLWLYGANIRTQADRVRCHASGPKTNVDDSCDALLLVSLSARARLCAGLSKMPVWTS